MIYKYRRIVEQKKGKRDKILADLKRLKKMLRATTRELRSSEEAHGIIQTVAKKTQDQLEYNLSNLVSVAMSSVLSDPCELKLEFTTKRGRVGTEMKFVRDEVEVDPMNWSAGGSVHIAALALRPSIHKISKPKRRDAFLLDEPLVALKGGDMPKMGSQLIKEISDSLAIQIIMVSHSDELIESADKVFKFEKVKGRSVKL